MKLEQIINGEFENHILPFLWIHGESEKDYRTNIQAIYNANIRAFCVEARPHKEFCRDGWWRDLAIILDEAKRLGMKVWILDDKHFPTGYAAGAVEHEPKELRRQSILIKQIKVKKGKVRLHLKKYAHPQHTFEQTLTDVFNSNIGKHNRFDDDTVISVTAFNKIGKEIVLLQEYVKNDTLIWNADDSNWVINICYLSRNCGAHRSYINMMDEKSVRLLIDAVYEPHYAHFGKEFGETIAGFFSDEPELGNGFMYHMYNYLGTPQDLPWSRKLEAELRQLWGVKFESYLPLLWINQYDEKTTAKIRYEYMNLVSKLVEECFSRQLGIWCREHGVEYIGHIIEDNNQHARTGTSLGHYFRGLKWQSMAGIDIIGNSLYPQKEILNRHNFIWKKEPADGEFYHFALAKMGSSMGQLNPEMKDRTMCELFGNYSWSEGVRLEKFLVDHCLVRGINYFVPHAFDCKPYPDKDCPPHFYAYGNDPLYRHFGELMAYTNRITSLFDGMTEITPVAVLYHGEAEWSSVFAGTRANPERADGKDAVQEGVMLMQKPARILQENQIGFHIIPADAFVDRDFYKTKITDYLEINQKKHELLLIPYSRFITRATADAVLEWEKKGGTTVFIEDFPMGICEGGEIPEELRKLEVVKLACLKEYLLEKHVSKLKIYPSSKRIRTMHLCGDTEMIMIVNEDDKIYEGEIELPWSTKCYSYDPWNNEVFMENQSDGKVRILLRPSECRILLKNVSDSIRLSENHLKIGESIKRTGQKQKIEDFKISCCRSIDYPHFAEKKPDSKFSGFIRYEACFQVEKCKKMLLFIEDAYEGVEVFVNEQSAGIQILPPFEYDITDFCVKGENQLCIEVATTLERENSKSKKNVAPIGIVGDVVIYSADFLMKNNTMTDCSDYGGEK